MNASRLFGRGPGPAMPDLPPTLLPHAIQCAAPPRSRRLSFLASCLVYVSVAGAFTLASRLNSQFHAARRNTIAMIITETETMDSRFVPPAPYVPAPARPPTLPPGMTRPENAAPVVSSDVPPEETPRAVPTVDISKLGLPASEAYDPSRQVSAGTQAGPAGAGATGSVGRVPEVVDIDFTNVKVLQQVAPLYPPLCRLSRLQGIVELLMTVDTRGVPTEIQVVSSPNASLSGSAMDAARQWRFAPAMVNGTPCSSRFRLTIRFSLKA